MGERYSTAKQNVTIPSFLLSLGLVFLYVCMGVFLFGWLFGFLGLVFCLEGCRVFFEGFFNISSGAQENYY